jgi:hypothetical protein
MKRTFLIIICVVISLSFSQTEMNYSLSIGEATTVTMNELGFGMPTDTTYDLITNVIISKVDNSYTLKFGECTESLILDGNPAPPVTSANSILRGKEITFNVSSEDYLIESLNLNNITREFNPVDPNLLSMILFPPVEETITNGAKELILDFPRVDEEKQTINETFSVIYTYQGESEFAGYTCEVLTFDFEGDLTGKIKGPLGDTISTGFGSGSGMLMYSTDLDITIWGELEYQLETVKNITLNNATYVMEELSGYGMSLSLEENGE